MNSNNEVLSFILAPFRLLMELWRGFSVLVVLLILSPLMLAMFLQGTFHEREAQVKRIHSEDISQEIDLRKSSAYRTGLGEDHSITVLPFTAKYKGQLGNPIVSFCGDAPALVKKGWDWSQGDDRWINAQRQEFESAYLIATYNVSVLRYELALLKLGRTLDKQDVCNPAAGTSEAFGDAYWRSQLPDAPVFTILTQGDSSPYNKQIEGFVLEGTRVTIENNWKQDIFVNKTPQSSPAQKLIFNTLYSTGDLSFWLKEAHANGIYDKDDAVRDACLFHAVHAHLR